MASLALFFPLFLILSLKHTPHTAQHLKSSIPDETMATPAGKHRVSPCLSHGYGRNREWIRSTL